MVITITLVDGLWTVHQSGEFIMQTYNYVRAADCVERLMKGETYV